MSVSCSSTFTPKSEIIQDSDLCGYCEQSEATIYWLNAITCCIHQQCYEIVQPAEVDLLARINLLFETVSDRNLAHKIALEAVRAKTGICTLEGYQTIHGAEKLKQLFDTVGIQAAEASKKTKSSWWDCLSLRD